MIYVGIFAIHTQLDLAEPVSARTARFIQWYGSWCDDFSFKGSLVTKKYNESKQIQHKRKDYLSHTGKQQMCTMRCSSFSTIGNFWKESNEALFLKM